MVGYLGLAKRLHFRLERPVPRLRTHEKHADVRISSSNLADLSRHVKLIKFFVKKLKIHVGERIEAIQTPSGSSEHDSPYKIPI